jgi:hypothetical protein
VFLSILFSTLPNKIRGAFQAAAAEHPDQARALQRAATEGGSASLDDTSFINRLPDLLAHPFKVGFSQAMSVVFLTAAAVMVVGLVVILFLPNLPLRLQSAAQERAQEDAATLAT